MSYRLPLQRRVALAQNKRDRYRTDPAYRLSRINEVRVKRGQEPHASLEQVRARVPL